MNNKNELIKNVEDFKNEICKPQPNKEKLKSTLEYVKNLSNEVFTALIVEFAKRYFNL